MGADYSSYAVVGVEIDQSKLFTTEKVRGCKCDMGDVNPETTKFCPLCGKEVWKEEETPIPAYNEDADSGPFYRCLGPYMLVFTTDYRRCFAGVILCGPADGDRGDEDALMAELPYDLKSIRDEMRRQLEPLGLWQEDKFGLWAVQHCSY